MLREILSSKKSLQGLYIGILFSCGIFMLILPYPCILSDFDISDKRFFASTLYGIICLVTMYLLNSLEITEYKIFGRTIHSLQCRCIGYGIGSIIVLIIGGTLFKCNINEKDDVYIVVCALISLALGLMAESFKQLAEDKISQNST